MKSKWVDAGWVETNARQKDSTEENEGNNLEAREGRSWKWGRKTRLWIEQLDLSNETDTLLQKDNEEDV